MNIAKNTKWLSTLLTISVLFGSTAMANEVEFAQLVGKRIEEHCIKVFCAKAETLYQTAQGNIVTFEPGEVFTTVNVKDSRGHVLTTGWLRNNGDAMAQLQLNDFSKSAIMVVVDGKSFYVFAVNTGTQY